MPDLSRTSSGSLHGLLQTASGYILEASKQAAATIELGKMGVEKAKETAEDLKRRAEEVKEGIEEVKKGKELIEKGLRE